MTAPTFLDTAREIVLDRPTFLTDGDTVFWVTAYGPYEIDHAEIHALLDIFEGSDSPAARKLYLDLYDAAARTTGFIPRVTSHRTEPTPKAGLRLVGSETRGEA